MSDLKRAWSSHLNGAFSTGGDELARKRALPASINELYLCVDAL